MTHQADSETWLLLDSRDVGGIETHVLHLARGLRARWGRVRVVFYADYGGHPLTKQLEEAGIVWECLDGSLRGLYAALCREPRLLHTHGYKAGLLGRLVGRWLGISVVSSFHAGEPGSGKVRLYNTLDYLTANLGVAIAVSSDIQRRIVGGAHLIKNFVPVAPQKTERTSSIVAFVGRLSYEKGPDIFCELAQLLPDMEFEIYGDGPMRAMLEERFGARVRFHGRVNRMDDQWERIGLLCMPSRHEGLPYAALEAMAHGIPVAAFCVGQLTKVIRHSENGWLAPCENVSALGSCIQHWSDLGEGRKVAMSHMARRGIELEYSPDVVVPRIIEIYQNSLLAGHRPKSPMPGASK